MGEEAEEQWLWGWGARADENGYFSIDGLAAGTYQIELSDPNGVYAVEVYADALNSGRGHRSRGHGRRDRVGRPGA